MTRRVRCLAFCGVLFVGHCRAADLDKDKFKGWSTYPLSRWLVQLDIAPALGGLIIAYYIGEPQFSLVKRSASGTGAWADQVGSAR